MSIGSCWRFGEACWLCSVYAVFLNSCYHLLFTSLHGVLSERTNLWYWPCHQFEKFLLTFFFSVNFQKAPVTITSQSIAPLLYILYFYCRLSQSLWISLYYGIWGELSRQASKRVGGALRKARSSWVLQKGAQGLTLTNLRIQWRSHIQIDSHITTLFSCWDR
jgi:hypothetical protein